MSEFNKLAFIIDDQVIDTINTDNRLAAMWLSEPLVIDITDWPNANDIKPGDDYNPTTGEITHGPNTATVVSNNEEQLNNG